MAHSGPFVIYRVDNEISLDGQRELKAICVKWLN